LKVEAVFDDFVPGGGKDDGDQIKMHYANETLANMPQILAARVHELAMLYCSHLTMELPLFALEHGPAFGINNETKPNFDAYDVAQRVLMVLETLDGFPVVSEAATSCRENVAKQHGPAGVNTPKRQHALWVVACMAEKQERVRAWSGPCGHPPI